MSYPGRSNLHALYATCDTPGGKRTFRIGLPASEAVIWQRYERFEAAHYKRRQGLRVHFARLSYPVRFLEIRAVDEQGRGLGRPDHFNARGVQVSALRIVPDGPYAITSVMGNKRWTRTGRTSAILATPDGNVIVGYGSNPPAAIAQAKREARINRYI